MRVLSSLLWAPFLVLIGTVDALFEKTVPAGSKTTIVKRNGVTVTLFEHADTGARLEYVSNVGAADTICEKTPGVKQHSGYLSVGDNMNMWFWFFEARMNASTAPLTAWFNGGPGCSSMIGLFQVRFHPLSPFVCWD
jgi:carboxypeptidase C (cathepsin A)